MFNEYVWQMYLNADGKSVIDLFEKNLSGDLTSNYAKSISNLHKLYCASSIIVDELLNELETTYEIVKDGVYAFEEGEYTIDSAMAFFYDDFKSEEDATAQSVFENFSGLIAYYTTLFARELPELFVPYYFKYNFNVLEKIANEFEIVLPEIPVKKDYEGRFFYYGELCAAFNEFRSKHNMTPYEFYAFLYDFAPKYIGGIDSYIVKDLPSAKSAYLIGGFQNDPFLVYDNNTITLWQNNPETLVGDNIILYLKTPISAIDSIWRSVSVGFIDPFAYYYQCAYVANPHKIKKVSLKTLKRDKNFKQLPIVRKNMQGLNGVEIYPSAYNHLLDISKSDLPRLEFVSDDVCGDLKREKDVENNLIKPFLKILGYTEKEYTQQLHIHVGNNNFKLIPDFVIHPNVSIGHHSAEFIVEAKYTVASEKELEIYKMQARSYANQLKAKYSVVASKEGIWVSAESDDFTKDFLVFTWSELHDNDNYQRVLKFLGNGNVLKSAEIRRKLVGRALEYRMFDGN